MTLRLRSAVVLITLLAGMATAQAQTTWHVDDANCPGPGSGTLPDPFCKIQDGIDAAVDGDTVLIADGTYTGNGNKNLNDAGKVITIQSENGPENCVIDCEDDGRGFAIPYPSGILSGLTITRGGGVSDGAALFIGGDPTIVNCVFSDNHATETGGAVRIGSAGSNPVFMSCRFVENTANEGGGVYSWTSDPLTFTSCIFSDNSADRGGGLYQHTGSIVMTDCTITGNTAAELGGGAYLISGNARLTGCVVSQNEATDGGGMFKSAGGLLQVVNGSFSGNVAANGAGIFILAGGSPLVTNCAFGGNLASEIGGGMLNVKTDAIITNCIFWGNSDGGGSDETAQIHDLGGSATTARYSLVQGLDELANTGNIDLDPLFADPVSHDLRLLPGSPCIDAASNADVPTDELDLDGDGDTAEPIPVDLDGNPRIVDDPFTPDCPQPDADCGESPVVDMGPYEFFYDCNDNGTPDECDIERGDSSDNNGNGVPDECDPCVGDLDGDFSVGPLDLALLLGSWGPCPEPPEPCPADIFGNGDGFVSADDLAVLLGNWGPCE